MITIDTLGDDLPFGARIGGVTHSALTDPAVRDEIRGVFDPAGIIVFERVEPMVMMQVAVSNVFGSLKEHPVNIVERVDRTPCLTQSRSASTPMSPSLRSRAGV